MPATVRLSGSPKGTFILLHGIGGWKDQRVMRAIIDPVYESGYNVVTFDAADGANAPDADSLNSTPTGYLEDLEDVIAYVKNEPLFVGPLSLGGHSLGALMALLYSAKHPEEIESLILASPAISWREYRPLIPVASVWLAAGKIRMLGPELKGYWLGRAWLNDFLLMDAKEVALLVRARTLVLIGGRDGLVGTVGTHRMLSKLIPGSTYEVVKGADHTFHPHEEALTATIRQWLTSS